MEISLFKLIENKVNTKVSQEERGTVHKVRNKIYLQRSQWSISSIMIQKSEYLSLFHPLLSVSWAVYLFRGFNYPVYNLHFNDVNHDDI